MDFQSLPLTLSVEEAGELLGISRQSAYRAASAGQLPVIRIGRRLIVPTGQLLGLLGVQSVATPEPGGQG